MLKTAIVRAPSRNLADGLTTAGLGRPDIENAIEQHRDYCDALRARGLQVVSLDPDPIHPDATFVEDTAVLTTTTAILTRPGAPSRLGEVASIRAPLARHFPTVRMIRQPGTLDGGDVCEAGSHCYIGLSERTNEEGAEQLAGLLAAEGYTSSCVDIRGMREILHLKSGIAYLGDGRFVATDDLARLSDFRHESVIVVDPEELYAANCIAVNDVVLVAAGFPAFRSALDSAGYRTVAVEMSEFQKMDGGLSCLSLRF